MISPRAHAYLAEEDLPAWSEPPEPESVGVDFLGLRPVNLNMLGELTQGFNNVATSARQHAILTWAAWRFCQNLKAAGRLEARRQEFSEFLDAVETVQLFGQDALAAEVGSSPMLGRFSLPRLRGANPIPLRFAAYGRTHETSAMAAVNYGPSAKPGGLDLIRGERGVWTATRDRGEPIAIALDNLLRRSRAYHHFERIEPPSEIDSGEALDLARNGLVIGPKLDARHEREAYTTALFALDRTASSNGSDRRRRTLALLMELIRIGDKDGVSADNIRRTLLAGRFRHEHSNSLPEYLRDVAHRWQVLHVRQLQRYAFESWLALAEAWMQRDYWSVDAMIDSVPSHLAAASDLPTTTTASMFGKPAADAFTAFIAAAGMEAPSEWAASDRPGGPWDLVARIASVMSDRSGPPDRACGATLALTLAVVKLVAAVVPEEGPIHEFAAQGDRRRISLVFFADWWQRRSQLPLRQVLCELMEELVLQQHVAVAVSRFDNEKRRLRFCNDERGWELLPGTDRSTPNLTQDRIQALLMLLCDLAIVHEVNPGSYVLDVDLAAKVSEEVVRLCG